MLDVAHGHGIFAALNSLLVFPDDETSLLRINPFAGKRCIVDRLPLPSCCDNPYCVAHLSKPSHDGHNVTAKDNLRKAALKIAFARHDKNSSGEGLYGKPQPLFRAVKVPHRVSQSLDSTEKASRLELLRSIRDRNVRQIVLTAHQYFRLCTETVWSSLVHLKVGRYRSRGWYRACKPHVALRYIHRRQFQLALLCFVRVDSHGKPTGDPQGTQRRIRCPALTRTVPNI